MRRRDFLALAGVIAAGLPIPAVRVAVAQQPAKLPRLVSLDFIMTPRSYIEGFQLGLSDRGFINGKTIALESQTAPTVEDLPAYAARIAATRPDIVQCY